MSDGLDARDGEPLVPNSAHGTTRAGFLKRVAVGGVVTTGGMGILAGCGNGDGNSAQSQDLQGSPAQGRKVTGSISDKLKGKTIGVPIYTMLDDNEVSILKWLKQAAEDAKLDWKFIATDTKATQATAQTAVQSMVTRKVDAIIDIVVPAAFIEPQLAAAKSAGIPVISTFSFAPFSENLTVDYSALLDHDAILMAHYLIGDQREARGRKDVKVGMLDAPLDVIVARRTAFEGVAEAEGAQIVARDFGISLTDTVQDATRRARGMLRAHPDITCLWCNYPPIALPVASGVAQAGETDVQVYGHIAQSAGVEALRDKTNPLVATTWVDWPYQSYTLIDLTLQALAGKQPDRLVSFRQPVPDVIFDASNVEAEVPKGQKAADWMFGGGAYRTGFVQRWNDTYAA